MHLTLIVGYDLFITHYRNEVNKPFATINSTMCLLNNPRTSKHL